MSRTVTTLAGLGLLIGLILLPCAEADRGRGVRWRHAVPSPESHTTAGGTGGIPEAPSCNYYASPTAGSGHGGLTQADAFRVADFFGVSPIAGKVLCLMD